MYLNKQKGDWYSNSAIGAISPGFDVHDLGFLYRTGIVNMHIGAGHQWTQTSRMFRYAELGGALFRSYDWDGNINWTGVYHFGDFRLLNYQVFNGDFAYNLWTVNNRRTRGGPLTLNPPGYQVDLGWQSDTRRPVTLNVNWGTYQARSDRNWYFMPSVDVRPKSNVLISVGPMLSHDLTPVQYVGTFTDSLVTATYGNRYVFGTLRQTEVSAGISSQLDVQPQAVAAAVRPAADLGGPLHRLQGSGPAPHLRVHRVRPGRGHHHPRERRHVHRAPHRQSDGFPHVLGPEFQLCVAPGERGAAVGVAAGLDHLPRVDAEPLGQREHRGLPIRAVRVPHVRRASRQHLPGEAHLLVESVGG